MNLTNWLVSKCLWLCLTSVLCLEECPLAWLLPAKIKFKCQEIKSDTWWTKSYKRESHCYTVTIDVISNLAGWISPRTIYKCDGT